MSGTLKNNFAYKFCAGTVDGIPFNKAKDLTISKSVEILEDTAGCDNFPYFSAEVGKSWSGQVTFASVNPKLLAAIMGGSTSTTGYAWISEESVTVSTSGTLANAGIEDSLIVTQSNGAKILRKVSATPALGEYVYTGGTNITFNASETDVVASYATQTTDGEQWSEGKSDTAPYVELWLVALGENNESGNASYTTWKFPRVKFSNFSFGVSNNEVNSITVDFTAYIPTDGQEIVYWTVEDS